MHKLTPVKVICFDCAATVELIRVADNLWACPECNLLHLSVDDYIYAIWPR